MLLAASAQGLTHATHQQAQTPLNTHTANQILTHSRGKKILPWTVTAEKLRLHRPVTPAPGTVNSSEEMGQTAGAGTA